MTMETDDRDERMNLPSASSMDAEMRCLGRRNLCKLAPTPATSKAAERGTLIHEVLEGKKKLEDLNKSDQVTANRIMHEEARLVEKYDFEGAKSIVEDRLWMSDDNFTPVYSGRVDRVHLKDKRAFVVDYKTGFSRATPITENWQIRTQAVLVSFVHGATEVTGALIHPHHPDSLSEVIVFSREQLEEYRETLAKFLADAAKPDAPRTPNATSCDYCAAKSMCPENKKWLGEVLPEEAGMIVRPNYELFSPVQRGKRLELFAMVEKIMEEEREAYKAMLKKDPLSVAGWKLQSSGETREVLDDQKALEDLELALGPGAKDCMRFSLSAAEAFLAEKGYEKAEIKPHLSRILGDNLKFKPKKPSLREA